MERAKGEGQGERPKELLTSLARSLARLFGSKVPRVCKVRRQKSKEDRRGQRRERPKVRQRERLAFSRSRARLSTCCTAKCRGIIPRFSVAEIFAPLREREREEVRGGKCVMGEEKARKVEM